MLPTLFGSRCGRGLAAAMFLGAACGVADAQTSESDRNRHNSNEHSKLRDDDRPSQPLVLTPVQGGQDDRTGDGAASTSPSDQATNEKYPNLARPPWTGPVPLYPLGPYAAGLYPFARHPAYDRALRGYTPLPRGGMLLPDGRLLLFGPFGTYAVPPNAFAPAPAAPVHVPAPFGPWPWAYGPYAPGGGFAEALADAHRAGRVDERLFSTYSFNILDMDRRKDRLLTHHEKTLRQGVERLREGDYSRAIVALTLASRLDNGDPACRVHLAQARLALGHYDEAGKVLRRALQLQPQLIYADLHLDRYYPEPGVLAELAARLRSAMTPRSGADERFLLGWVEFQLGRFEAAHAEFRRVAAALPKDDLAARYLEVSRPASTNDRRTDRASRGVRVPADRRSPSAGGSTR